MANEVLLQDSPTRSHPPIAKALYIAAALIISGAILFSFAAVNGQLFRALNALLPVQNLWLPLSAIGDGLSVGCLLYILFRARSDILAAALIAGLMVHFAAQGLKALFAITRPEHTPGFEHIYLLGPPLAADNFALPSGHAITALMMGTFILQQVKLTAITKMLLVSMLVLTCLSRIAVGAHWPVDILVGSGLGILIGTLCGRLPIKINHRWLVLFIHALFLPFFILAIARYFSGAGADLHNIVITLLGISALGVWSLALLRELKQCSSAAIKEDS